MAEEEEEEEPDSLTTPLSTNTKCRQLSGGASLEVNGIEQHVTVDVAIIPTPKDGISKSSCYYLLLYAMR